MNKPWAAIHVGLIGLGTIGTGVARVLHENTEVISRRLGTRLVLKTIADLDITTDRGIDTTGIRLTTDVNELFTDERIDIVIELIGGYEPARTFVERALAAGKHVVTANKALLAKHGNELFAVAAENGVDLYYEASVGGGIPIIKVMREGLPANRIKSLSGILNGTCNYILTKMSQEGGAYADVLAEAQALGYAEADPTFDVEGIDTAHKLSILTALAFGRPIDYDGVYCEGISDIQPLDIAFARDFGYVIKLLAIARMVEDKIESRVHPTMIPADHMLAKIDGVFNAVYVDADRLGPSLYYGRGAGMDPTASAVVADIIDIGRNMQTEGSRRIPDLGWQPGAVSELPCRPIADITTNYYLRFTARDQPGVLSAIAGILGDNQISIASVIQEGRSDDGSTVPIVMQTHPARERNLKRALAEIDRLPAITAPTVIIRMENAL
ncbi:MAG: homoserine dehydrogenase [Deltaproteobacteria bacterium]|nr:homoserine dehydrogenase [Candidatus Anaeroferrophillacea bacterium]